MNKLIILDRDGVINQDSLEYIKSPEEFIFLPKSLEAIARLKQAGYRIAVATNQSGIARGFYDDEILEQIHNKLQTSVQEAGGAIDYIEYCPHFPESGCDCRKPNPGMLHKIAVYFQCSLRGVAYVGDRISDIEVALQVGAKPSIVISNMTDRQALMAYPEVPQFESLYDFVDDYLRHA